MDIFYTASYYGKAKYQKYYDLILKALESLDVSVISPEKGNYFDILTKQELVRYKDPKQKHYEAIRKGIQWSDAVVIEVSNEGFQLGHEATLAIQNKKHVLCLSVNEDFSEKIKTRYFHGAKYNEFNLEEVVEDFINKVKGELLDMRFNMFLSQRQVNYLEEAAKDKNMNKSEYIRLLVDKDRLSQ